jgi:multisubunit Na+/H+ antiporter MnhE subunit
VSPEEMILDIFVRLFPGVTFVDVNQAHRIIVQDIKFQQEIRSQLVKQKNTYRVAVFFTVNRHWEPEKKIWD